MLSTTLKELKVAGTKSCEVANFSGQKKGLNVAGIKSCELHVKKCDFCHFEAVFSPRWPHGPRNIEKLKVAELKVAKVAAKFSQLLIPTTFSSLGLSRFSPILVKFLKE